MFSSAQIFKVLMVAEDDKWVCGPRRIQLLGEEFDWVKLGFVPKPL